MRVNPINLDNAINRAKSAPVVATPTRAFADQLEMTAGLTGEIGARDRGVSGVQPGLLQFGDNAFARINQLMPAGEGERQLLPLVPPPMTLGPLDETDFVPGTRKAVENEHDRIAATARKWLAQTFYGTMLKQMRNSPFKSELFEGGRGGQVFSTMLDQHLADSMAKSTDQTLVASIARKLSARSKDLTAEAQRTRRNEKQEIEQGLNPNKDIKIHVAPNLRS